MWPGPSLVEIGLAAIRQMDIRLHARPVLEDLASRFSETVHLAVLEGSNVRYLDAVESSRALRVAATDRLGARGELHGLGQGAACRTAGGRGGSAVRWQHALTALTGGR